MKTRSLILTVLALTFALAPSTPNTAVARDRENMTYRARLVSPKAGDVLKVGQTVKIVWTAEYPDVPLDMCEMEILLSTDGGQVFNFVTEQRNPKIQYYNWTVPPTPTKTAILDIRFGCMALYPETPSIQSRSVFTIAD